MNPARDAALTQADLGARIASARERAGISQARLGEVVGISQSAVSRLEAGERGVDSLELAKIAREVGVAVSMLLAEPDQEFALAARLASGDDPQPVRRAIARVVELAKLDRLLAAGEANGGRGPSKRVTPPRHGGQKDVDQGLRLAERVRRDWGLDDDPLPQNLLDLIERKSGLGFVLEPTDGVAGLCAFLDDHGIALIDSSATVGRQRFTAAHELCHFLCGDRDATDPIVVDQVFGSKRRVERRANAFAAHFLMPRSSVLRYLDGREVTGEVVAGLQHTFGVSLDSLLWQLFNFGLIGRAMRDQLSAVGSKALAVRHGFGTQWKTLEAARDARQPPHGLLRRALSAYAKGTIGIEPVANLLGRTDTEDLRSELEAQGIGHAEKWWSATAPA